MIPFKYCNREWSPRPVDAGFVLTSKATPRVLLVTPKGVYECNADATPRDLIDCGELTLLKVKAHLGDVDCRAQVAADERARRVKLVADAVKAAEEAAKKTIAEADAKLAGEAKT